MLQKHYSRIKNELTSFSSTYPSVHTALPAECRLFTRHFFMELVNNKCASCETAWQTKKFRISRVTFKCILSMIFSVEQIHYRILQINVDTFTRHTLPKRFKTQVWQNKKKNLLQISVVVVSIPTEYRGHLHISEIFLSDLNYVCMYIVYSFSNDEINRRHFIMMRKQTH